MGWPMGLEANHGTVPLAVAVHGIVRPCYRGNTSNLVALASAWIPSPDASQRLGAGEGRVSTS